MNQNDQKQQEKAHLDVVPQLKQPVSAGSRGLKSAIKNLDRPVTMMSGPVTKQQSPK